VLLIGFSALVLILCAVRYAQLRADRLHRATQYQQPARRTQPVRAPKQASAANPQPSARDAWVANALRANPGLTPEAAAVLYKRVEEIKDAEGDPFME